MIKKCLHSPVVDSSLRVASELSLLLLLGAMFLPLVQLRAAEGSDAERALEGDPEGWVDILPGPELKGWIRVPVPPTGKLGRAQWHVDTDAKVLTCDGDGGHDMLLFDKEIGDA